MSKTNRDYVGKAVYFERKGVGWNGSGFRTCVVELSARRVNDTAQLVLSLTDKKLNGRTVHLVHGLDLKHEHRQLLIDALNGLTAADLKRRKVKPFQNFDQP